MTVSADIVAQNIIFEDLLFMVLLIMMKKVASSEKNIPTISRIEYKNHTTLFLTMPKRPKKPYP